MGWRRPGRQYRGRIHESHALAHRRRDGLDARGDVGLVRARKPADNRAVGISDLFGDDAHGLRVTKRGGGKTGLPERWSRLAVSLRTPALIGGLLRLDGRRAAAVAR